MKKIKIILFLITLTVIYKAYPLTNREKIELYNIIKIVELQPNKTLTQSQKTILKKYIDLSNTDPSVKEKIDTLKNIKEFNFDQLDQPIKNPQPTITSVTTKPVVTQQQKLVPQQIEKEKTPQALTKQFAQLETQLYSSLYYDKDQQLLTLEGIEDIIKTIKKDQPAIQTNQLKEKTYSKAIELLKAITQKTTLSKQTEAALQQLIDATLGETTTTSVTTPMIKELPTSRPLIESSETTPKTFTSSIAHMTAETLTPLPEPLSNQLMKFVQYSKQKGSSFYLKSGSIDQDWLLKSVKLIIDGPFKKEKTEEVTQKLFKMIDILVAAPLRNDTSITDEEYNKIVVNLENTIKEFVNKLEINKIYRKPQ